MAKWQHCTLWLVGGSAYLYLVYWFWAYVLYLGGVL